MFTLLCENYFINIRLLILFKKKKKLSLTLHIKRILNKKVLMLRLFFISYMLSTRRPALVLQFEGHPNKTTHLTFTAFFRCVIEMTGDTVTL